MSFPTSYQEIMKRIGEIKPQEYAKNRNYTNGAVTHLSPYISRGVISAKQVLQIVQANGFEGSQLEKLTQELTWREYYQRVWQHIQDDIFEDILHRYTGIQNNKIPVAILAAKTGIQSIDSAIDELRTTGYMHNHMRMYLASIICNIGKSNWQLPAQWMYYHLLDGDLASNSCSWQWITGNFSTRQYFCNQENINKYTGSKQVNSFLDKPYEELPVMKVPDILKEIASPQLNTILPEKVNPELDTTLPLLIYTSYNLDPNWKKEIKANRILLLEPSHFKQYPVSEKVIDFILNLAKNIDGIQVFTGELNEITGLNNYPAIISKEHPTCIHFPGVKEERDWLFPETKGFFPSFFRFWNAIQKTNKTVNQLKQIPAVA